MLPFPCEWGSKVKRGFKEKKIYYFICRLQTNPYKNIVRIEKQTNPNCYVRWDGIVKFCQVGLDIRNEYKIMKRVKENNTFQLGEGGHVESANKESCSVSKPAGRRGHQACPALLECLLHQQHQLKTSVWKRYITIYLYDIHMASWYQGCVLQMKAWTIVHLQI